MGREEKKQVLSSFYEHSLFKEGLFNPIGYNISPRASLKENEYSKYSTKSLTYGLNNYGKEITYLSNNSYDMTIQGNCELFEEQKYEYEKNYKMIDRLSFISKISLNENFTKASINTTASIVRSTTGLNYSGISIRDGMFKNLNHANSKNGLSINEYFELLEDGRVLHYSDYSDLYEIFDTNLTSLKEGINSILNPKIFNKNNIEQVRTSKAATRILKK